MAICQTPTLNFIKIWNLQAENEVVGLELQKQLEAAGNMIPTV
jgi:hypothetical protein